MVTITEGSPGPSCTVLAAFTGFYRFLHVNPVAVISMSRMTTDRARVDGPAAAALLKLGKYFTKWDETDDGRVVFRKGGRQGDVFYRDRWSHDKVVRSTHGVNCTGSCSWKVYVKDGIISWETQETDYPTTGPDLPEYEPRGCPRGAAFSWYEYSPNRVS